MLKDNLSKELSLQMNVNLNLTKSKHLISVINDVVDFLLQMEVSMS